MLQYVILCYLAYKIYKLRQLPDIEPKIKVDQHGLVVVVAASPAADQTAPKPTPTIATEPRATPQLSQPLVAANPSQTAPVSPCTGACSHCCAEPGKAVCIMHLCSFFVNLRNFIILRVISRHITSTEKFSV